MVCSNARKCINASFCDSTTIECPDKIKCLKYSDCRNFAKCEENSVAYTIDNKKEKFNISLLRIDEGIIKGNDSYKCDYLFTLSKNDYKCIILVELKGTDIIHAMEQISDTMNYLNLNSFCCNKVFARIIHNGGVPNLYQSTPQYIKLYKRIKKLNGDIQLKRLSYTEPSKNFM